MRGFTLIEVLIALAILSIGILSMHFVLDQVLFTHSYSLNKLRAIEKGNEVILKLLNFEDYPLDEMKLEEESVGIKLDKKPFLMDIYECTLSVTYKGATVSYTYYETFEK